MVQVVKNTIPKHRNLPIWDKGTKDYKNKAEGRPHINPQKSIKKDDSEEVTYELSLKINKSYFLKGGVQGASERG